MAKRKGLGRGLDALLGSGASVKPADAIKAATSAAADPSTEVDGVLKQIPVELLSRGKYQPRRDMHPEALKELSESIKAQGVMQPIVVRPIDEHTYEIIAGERRWRATQLAGLDKIPAIVRHIPDETAIAMALIENIQREDLNPMEEAVALKRLQDEFDLTHQEVGEAVGKSRTTVSNLMRLLNLSDELRTMVEHGDLEMGHARCLLNLEPEQQRTIARQIIAKGLSVRQAEALARSAVSMKTAAKNDEKTQDGSGFLAKDIEKLEERLSEHVGLPIDVKHGAKGKGKITFKYSSLDELDGLLANLKFEM